ncbi:MAG: metallophosphoesterase [Candidatus Bathyarchaeota archaeon]|nr:metallophosphoesterase [Candidatus Bathyarchaeota archaeon]
MVAREKTSGDTNMLIGIMSDTHDNLPLIEKAVNRLNQEKVDLVLHAGDFTSPFVMAKFKALNCKLVGVFGNNDGDHELLRKKCSEAGNCEIRGRFAEVDAEGFKIALLHGDETELLNALTSRECFDTVISGHVHVTDSKSNGKTLIVNPGELCGYLTGKATFALLDTVKREAKIIEL